MHYKKDDGPMIRFVTEFDKPLAYHWGKEPNGYGIPYNLTCALIALNNGEYVSELRISCKVFVTQDESKIFAYESSDSRTYYRNDTREQGTYDMLDEWLEDVSMEWWQGKLDFQIDKEIDNAINHNINKLRADYLRSLAAALDKDGGNAFNCYAREFVCGDDLYITR